MLVTTTMNIEGFKITDYKGIVRGLVVRSPTIVQGFMGGLKNILGGQIDSYALMCEQTRQESYDLMIEHAAGMGANAIIGMRYDTSEVVSRYSASEVLCYGTAVILSKERE
jgi:uncharacterized protein YbjQ (UPF0145 family)